MKFANVVVLILSFGIEAVAFSPVSNSAAAHDRGTLSLGLVPEQGADLEACAYVLMKEALEEKARQEKLQSSNANFQRDISKKISLERESGPVHWIRRGFGVFQFSKK